MQLQIKKKGTRCRRKERYIKCTLQIKGQDAGVKSGTLDATTNKGTRCRCTERQLDATTNKGTRCRCKERHIRCTLQIKAQDAGLKRDTLDATTNKGTRCRCKERHIRCNYK